MCAARANYLGTQKLIVNYHMKISCTLYSVLFCDYTGQQFQLHLYMLNLLMHCLGGHVSVCLVAADFIILLCVGNCDMLQIFSI